MTCSEMPILLSSVFALARLGARPCTPSPSGYAYMLNLTVIKKTLTIGQHSATFTTRFGLFRLFGGTRLCKFGGIAFRKAIISGSSAHSSCITAHHYTHRTALLRRGK